MPTLTPRPPDWIDTAPVRASASIAVSASPEAVWGVLADHAGWVDWFDALDDVRVTRGATGVGGGRRVSSGPVWFEEEFTVWDPPEDGGPGHFAFTIVRSNLPVLESFAESVRLTPAQDGQTLVGYRQGLAARWGLDPVLRLAWRVPAADLPDALAELRALAESS